MKSEKCRPLCCCCCSRLAARLQLTLFPHVCERTHTARAERDSLWPRGNPRARPSSSSANHAAPSSASLRRSRALFANGRHTHTKRWPRSCPAGHLFAPPPPLPLRRVQSKGKHSPLHPNRRLISLPSPSSSLPHYPTANIILRLIIRPPLVWPPPLVHLSGRPLGSSRLPQKAAPPTDRVFAPLLQPLTVSSREAAHLESGRPQVVTSKARNWPPAARAHTQCGLNFAPICRRPLEAARCSPAAKGRCLASTRRLFQPPISWPHRCGRHAHTRPPNSRMKESRGGRLASQLALGGQPDTRGQISGHASAPLCHCPSGACVCRA